MFCIRKLHICPCKRFPFDLRYALRFSWEWILFFVEFVKQLHFKLNEQFYTVMNEAIRLEEVYALRLKVFEKLD